mmetsp:Transcript_14584/g.50825  ORF Transcript_14584/g.50825 Transcript_14584/m.50825 type:complete len:347 (-) Transcript_14584:239-1279(-)
MALRIAAPVARIAVRRPVPVRAVLRSPAVVLGARALSTAARTAPRGAAPVAAALTLAGAAGLGAFTLVAADDAVDYNKVREAIADLLDAEGYDDGSYGPVLVRLAWHASGTYVAKTGEGGSAGATMRFKPESEDGANAGLHVARALLEPVKRKFPGISYADLWTLAACVAIEEMGGPKIEWRPGRSDAAPTDPVPPNGRLPDAAQGASHVRDVFYRMGFSDREIVALAGAHALGRCHADRSGFEGPWTRAPTTFSNEYFRLLLDETWTEKKVKSGNVQLRNKADDLMMLPADLAIRNDPKFRPFVEEYAKNEEVFFKDFAAAFKKLIENGVKFPAEKKGWWASIFG